MSNCFSKDSFSLGYKKIGIPKKEDLEQLVSDDTSIVYHPFKLADLQNYNPIYSEIFKLSSKNYNSISLNQKNQFLFTKDKQTENSNTVNVDNCFIKYSPLLDPYRYLTGKYTIDDSLMNLPKIDNGTYHSKLKDPNNASYIDNFFCYLSSNLLNHHGFVNSIDYYGSFLGIQEKFRVNIADDIDNLRSSDFFINQKNTLYEIYEVEEDPFMNFGSRKNKDKLLFHNESNISQISVDNLDGTSEKSAPSLLEDIEVIYKTEHEDEVDDDSSNNSDMNYTSSEDNDEDDDEDEDEDEDEDNDEDEDEDEDEDNDEDEDESSDSSQLPLYAYIHNFPIQLICLEPCKGTIDSLFESGSLDENTAAAALMQIIMSMIAFQHAFHFTHNDLHTNNIMFIETEEKYLYYEYNQKIYKVPTYGKIYKIIDFGRAIYKFNGKIYCSDSFSPEGDANTQYNFEPWFNPNKPRIEPNYSFDLCRLGCSIFDFILDEDYQQGETEFDELQRTIIRWCSDDNGKNVLYKKSGEERYPNFKLYKMIARTVHQHTPEAQLNDPYFKQFMLSDKKTKTIEKSKIINIDKLPSYT
jgi:hypothetical protein